jgi:TRAP-type uncharacterized transport system fused permease subunit
MLSVITAPVAVAAFVAATIGRADPMKTALKATRLAGVIYFIPFFFIYNPALIFQGRLLDTAVLFLLSLVGVMLIAGGMEGYVWKLGSIGWLPRLLIG